MTRYHSRYKFIQDFAIYLDSRLPEPRVLIAACFYEYSFLLENINDQPFPYLTDPVIGQALRKTTHFIQGVTELEILRKIEDMVVLDYKPVLIQVPPVDDELHHPVAKTKRYFDWLDTQVEEAKLNLSKSWFTENSSKVFQHVSGTIESIQRLVHQFNLENRRFLTLNKYSFLQQVKTEFGIQDLSSIYTSVRASQPERPEHAPADNWTEIGSNFIKDFNAHRRPDPVNWTHPSAQEQIEKAQNRYPFTRLRTHRLNNWILLNTSIQMSSNRFVFSDLDIRDPCQRGFLGWKRIRKRKRVTKET